MDGDVTVRVTHSTVNYKDGLALTGKAPVVRRFPMIPGIDFAGVVETSSHPEFKPGDTVVLNGWGSGETHLGGYAQKARVKGDWLVPLPHGLSRPKPWRSAPPATRRCSACWRSNATASSPPRPGRGDRRGGRRRLRRRSRSCQGWLARHRLDRPARGGRLSEGPRRGGDHRARRSRRPARPLGKERWAAGIDSVGSHTLANLLSMTRTAAPSRPAGSPAAWTCRPPSRPSSCAACRCSASTASWPRRRGGRPGSASPATSTTASSRP